MSTFRAKVEHIIENRGWYWIFADFWQKSEIFRKFQALKFLGQEIPEEFPGIVCCKAIPGNSSGIP